MTPSTTLKNNHLAKRDNNSIVKNTGKKYHKILLFLVLLLPLTLEAQTDYTGTYYIGSNGYNSGTPANNYYLCPTEGWCFYQATDDFTSTDNGMPFLTTHKCRDGVYNVNEKAVWYIEKHPTQNYYYIRRAYDGKYIVFNGQIRTTTNADRMRVHLEAVGTPDDNALFAIIKNGNAYNIQAKADPNAKYWTVNGGNKNDLTGQSGKANGPTGYVNTAGIIGIYQSLDGNSNFYLEKATIDAPVITNNYTVSNTFTITAASGATIYYTTDGTTPTLSTPTTGTTTVNITQTNGMTVIKAIAKHPDDYFPTPVVTYTLPVCERPFITVDNSNNVTISCSTPNAAIHYTNDGTPASASSTLYSGSFSLGGATTIRAIATSAGYASSNEAVYLPAITVHSSSEIVDMSRSYILASDFTSTASIGTALAPFRGTIDGQFNVINGLSHPLVAYADGATIKNVILDNVSINSGTNIGAICGEATGSSRIYNCGVMATGSTVEKDEDGYDVITSCSSTISGSGFVGGIVGLLDGTSRVINCFSYANITGGDLVGGIVGKNNVATTAVNLKTMVMNCMFYGEITGGTSIAPIYNGEIITNVGENVGVSNFNYFRLEASYIQNTSIAKVYNCALGAETRFLQRFEFFRHLLNSNRELAAWWATGDASNKDEMAKWVLEPSQIGSTTPYPILKTPGKYASVVNIDAEHASTGKPRNQGGKLGTLTVNIQMGSGGAVFGPPAGAAITTSSLTLNITDKDTAHFNFNYYKVQLPYYNDVGTKNYNGNRVVTGWKIVNITGGTAGSFTTGTDAPAYNFADRNCTNKDLYGTGGSNRIFSQGAYWDVPEGVTAITIEPYWAKCAYVADAYADVVYNTGMDTKYDVPNVGGGQKYSNNTLYTIAGEQQKVFTTVNDAVTNADGLNKPTSNTVNDYAVVLVGNVHQYFAKDVVIGGSYKYTVTTVDLDGDNEPDYSFMLRNNGRNIIHPLKWDFLNVVGLGMAQKSTGGTGSYNLGILIPRGWFESTNTSLFRVTQFEYEHSSRATTDALIVQGGVMEQWVSSNQKGTSNKIPYIHVGGNVWFKEFHTGCHQDKDTVTLHSPISVTGGDYDEFYLTGLYVSCANSKADNAECYINGGRFGIVCGAAMEGIGKANGADNTGNITWQVQNADIREFYAGALNAARPATGNISTTITGGYIGKYCGGPKFGDMSNDKTVTTTATGCTFGTFFGAGYGGNSYSRQVPKNHTSIVNFPHNDGQAGNHASWNAWLAAYYLQNYNGTYGGVSTQFNYQFLPMSDNQTNVARIFVEYVKFSLATTHSVTSTLTECTILDDFYGGGSLGKVDGNVVSTLKDCIVHGSVFGAGFSASLPDVEVDSIGFKTEPYYYEQLGTYRAGVKKATTTYKWEEGGSMGIDKTNHILYTTEDLDGLGMVEGDAEIRIYGNSKIYGNVYGGGNQGVVGGNTKVIVNQEK
ncbi:MAG: chitobiase/beta-hexosaminidase C-terminal domain-containing protein [Bacteroidales bacterium]|nr:chitobiase/beta-hexosaminidase C-terminal domain-containing protein [Bacteroidales bacterium]